MYHLARFGQIALKLLPYLPYLPFTKRCTQLLNETENN